MEKELQNKRYRIRKLTPRECFRLMDVCESDIDKIQTSGVSESQQYKMAGNSIVVACMVGIFKNLFTNEEEEMVGQLTLF
jgi:DNA (cytosine-5)-methyltransferase 1